MMMVLPREMRLVIERILLLTALPAGSVPAVRDVVLYSASAGLGGFALLQQRFADLRAADLSGIEVGATRVDGAGQHAWMVLPLVLDALGEAVARDGTASLAVDDVRDPEELRTATALGARAGLAIEVANGVLTANAAQAEDAVLSRALRHGVAVEPALWWELHHLSNTSLSPDTPESRRHAGPVIVEADGRVIGRSDHDDDTDLSMLTEAKPSEAA